MIATVAMAVAISVMAPIIGTAISLVVLVALRAASITARQLAKRRSADGRRASDPLLAVALYPLAALRALFGLLLSAPVAVLAFCVAAAATIIVVPVHPLPQAVAFGAGALVAVVGLGPGSSNSRKALASAYTSAARSAEPADHRLCRGAGHRGVGRAHRLVSVTGSGVLAGEQPARPAAPFPDHPHDAD